MTPAMLRHLVESMDDPPTLTDLRNNAVWLLDSCASMRWLNYGAVMWSLGPVI